MRKAPNGTEMTKRITISVDDEIYEALEVQADKEVRTIANLAAAIVTQVVREQQQPKKK